jgi:hypothetical protein
MQTNKSQITNHKSQITNRLSSVIFLTALISFTSVFAQDIQFKAYVDKTELSASDYLTYTAEVSGGVSNIKTPETPDFNADFYVLSGPSQSTNYQFINGNMSFSVSVSFTLQPKRTGEIVIPSAKVTIKKQTYQTEPITIKVTNGGSSSSQPPSQSSTPPPSQPAKSNQIDRSGDLILRAEPDKTTLYQNDAVIINYKLYFKLTIRAYEITKLPKTTGFWLEEFEIPQQPIIGSEVLNGVRYQVALIRKVALFPTTSGKLTVEPMEAQCNVLERRRGSSRDPFSSFFNDPFFNPTVETPRFVQSGTLALNVLSLPDNGKPDDFTGAVGNFRMDVALDKDSVQTNDPITLTVKLSGRGNIKMAPAPKIAIPADFEQYEPEISSNIDKSGGAISGYKIFKYLLVPRLPGVQNIPPLKYSFFDPVNKKYNTLVSKPLNIKVWKGKEIAMPGGITIAPGEVKIYGQDIRFIKSESALKPLGSFYYQSVVYYLFYLIPLGLFLGGMVSYSYYLKLNPDKLRAKFAFRNARLALDRAQKIAPSTQAEPFFRTLGEGLRKFTADKAGLSPTGLLMEEAKEMLLSHGISETSFNTLTKIIAECDMARFSPSPMTDSGKIDLAQNAIELLNTMEKEWKN